MTASIDSASDAVRATLQALSREDQSLFLKEKQRYLARPMVDSPLLDQLCCLRVVMARLSEGYTAALHRFTEGLAAKAEMPGGWRKSVTRKLPGEFESPMPWVHPFKLARGDLEPLEQAWEEALARGETEARDPGWLQGVLDRHELELPLGSPHIGPRFRPGAVRVFKESE
jgi:hypothetical protein